jgi:hypothetical protein
LIDPVEREKECTNHSFAWSGKMPNTGRRRCHKCGTYEDDITESKSTNDYKAELSKLKKHRTAKKENRLVKAGYITKKGEFGAVKVDKTRKSRRGSRKMKGGRM